MTRLDEPRRWEFWIDRGGTFTDCIGCAPDGALHVFKLLSSETAPIDGMRAILERTGAIAAGAPLPAANVRMGTTVATNALLERRGVPTLLVANRGLGDVLEIGTQQRPELFALRIVKPAPIPARTLEIGGRVSVGGELLEALDEVEARRAFAEARRAGIESVAIALIHAYAHPEVERRLRALADEAGFGYVSCSHEIACEIGLLARSETAAVDAYLTPLLRSHLTQLRDELPRARLRFMQSSGGLTDAARFKGPNALLSGPAGGVVGAARVAAAAGFERALGFDMGGTSTDVSMLRAGEIDRCFETLLAGVRVKAPMMRIHSIAAGGGSLCRYDGMRFLVGPESAGAQPGPLCYARADAAGNALARELSLTDCNFALGRVQGDRFPFALTRKPVDAALDALALRLRADGRDFDRDAIAAGFVEVANSSMARAIAEVSIARGVDPRDCALVGFGGAAGQHVCAIARELGVRTVLLHPLAGVLSAFGIGVAESSWDGQRDVGRVLLTARGEAPREVRERLEALAREGRRALVAEGFDEARLRVEPALDLRYRGTETALSVRAPADCDYARAARRRARFASGSRRSRAKAGARSSPRASARRGCASSRRWICAIAAPRPRSRCALLRIATMRAPLPPSTASGSATRARVVRSRSRPRACASAQRATSRLRPRQRSMRAQPLRARARARTRAAKWLRCATSASGFPASGA